MKFLKVFLFIYLIFSVETHLTYQEKMKALESLKELSESYQVVPSKDGNLRKELEPITTAALIVAAVCALYRVAVFLFGYHKTVDYIDIPMERGFDYFYSDSLVHYVYDIPKEKIERVKAVYCNVLGIAPNDQKNRNLMNDLFDYIEFQDMGGWGKQDILYQPITNRRQVHYASVVALRSICDKTKKEVYHFILMTTSATFSLAKTLQMKVTHEGFGVVSNKVRSELYERDTPIIQQDLDDIIKFFNFVCLKAMASYFGQKFEFPKLQKKK